MDFFEIVIANRQYISLLDYDSRFFYFLSSGVVFNEMWRNSLRKNWNFIIYQFLAQYHDKSFKKAMHHKKVLFLGIKIPLETWKNIENSGFGKRFCARRWNFPPEKLQTAIGNNRGQVAAGWVRILHRCDPRMKKRPLKIFLETKISKCNLTLMKESPQIQKPNPKTYF